MTSKSSRKSIVANFGLLSAELENRLSTTASETPQQPAAPVPTRVGAGVIGAAHRAIDDIKSERDRLKALLESGGGAIREIDPSMIDPSPFPDRLPDDDASDFETFRNSVKSEGQKVPIQVRRSPSSPDRYQVIYGHRRLRAAKELGFRSRRSKSKSPMSSWLFRKVLRMPTARISPGSSAHCLLLAWTTPTSSHAISRPRYRLMIPNLRECVPSIARFR